MSHLNWNEYSGKKILIYGAHLVALECYRDIVCAGMRDKVLGFAVSDKRDNPDEIETKPVKCIGDYRQYAGEALVVIAMPTKYHTEVETYATNLGFTEFLKLDLERMSQIKGERLIERSHAEHIFPFKVQRSVADVSWLDAFANGEEGTVRCKFPTLFYLDNDEVIEKSKELYGIYLRELGDIRDISSFPMDGVSNINNGLNDSLIQIYMAFGEREADFVQRHKFDSWVRPLQVGSKNAATRYGDLFDDEGADNRSADNSFLAEMTGAYWIWKRASKSEYKGLCHYRRHFALDVGTILTMKNSDVDVLFTAPRYVPGGIRGMFVAETPVKEYVIESILSSMAEYAADDREHFERYLDANFYFPNNMVVAKSDIYDQYCAWIFPILIGMIEIDLRSDYGHERDRHIAYAAELLTSYYFIKRKGELKITFTDYRFYG